MLDAVEQGDEADKAARLESARLCSLSPVLSGRGMGRSAISSIDWVVASPDEALDVTNVYGDSRSDRWADRPFLTWWWGVDASQLSDLWMALRDDSERRNPVGGVLFESVARGLRVAQVDTQLVADLAELEGDSARTEVLVRALQQRLGLESRMILALTNLVQELVGIAARARVAGQTILQVEHSMPLGLQ